MYGLPRVILGLETEQRDSANRACRICSSHLCVLLALKTDRTHFLLQISKGSSPSRLSTEPAAAAHLLLLLLL